MPIRLSRPLVYLFVILLLGFSYSCKKDRNAKALPAEVGNYVYAFTSGVISKADPIRVQFAGIVIDEEMVDQEADANILQISPSIKGTATWEDRQTLIFHPEEHFNSGENYLAKVQLNRIYDNLPTEVNSFEFNFKIRAQMISLSLDEPYNPDISQLNQQALSGQLQTADWAENGAVEGVLEARQGGRALTISWEHPASGNSHKFVIGDIERKKKAEDIIVSFDGKVIGAKQKGQETKTISALGDFKLLSVKANGGSSPHLILHFSDPLATDQNLNGLVSIEQAAADNRYLVRGNQLLVYPTGSISGDRTVRIDGAIKNSQGKSLDRVGQWTVSFTANEPQVRLVGNGVIMPDGEGLLFPFEAVGLNAIELEIFKIYSNNMLQFLQNNRLDGDYQLNQIGRVTLRRKIDLFNLNPDYNSSNWTRYALDLRDLIQEDQNAIYQVRIGFRPEYADNNCVDMTAISGAEDPLADEGDNIYGGRSIMDLYYGFAGYYDSYSWRDRDNPCSPAYYNRRRFVSRNIIAGNLGITAKSGDDRDYLVVVNDLRTTKPVSGATVSLYDYQQQLLATSQTGNDGFAKLELDRKPYVAIAEYGGQKGYLRLVDGESLSMSAFKVAGAVVQKGMKGFLYGDRGVWRPGDSVYLNFILEDKEAQLPPDYPVQFELRDARGQVQIKRTALATAGNIYPLHFATNPDDPTGIWYASVKAGGATFSKNLRIETVRPNRLKIDLNTGGDFLSATDGDANVNLNASWLYGAPADGLKAEVEMALRPDNSGFESFKDYRFNDPGRNLNSEPFTVFAGNLDASGNARFQLNGNYVRQAPGKLKAGLKTRVFEPGGDFSSDNVVLDYSPYQSYSGIQLPKNRWGSNELTLNKDESIDFVAVDEKGQAISGRNLTVGLYRVEWRWWWDDGYDNVSQYNSQDHLNALERTSLTTNNNGKVSWQTKIEEWGRYLVRVCDTQSGHCAGDYFYAGSPRYGDDDVKAASVVMFESDKEKYAIGEQVKLTLPTPDAGRALVSLEDGDGVIDAFWIETNQGETEISFEASSDMAPTVYANISLFQPHQQTANDLPIRLYGVIPISVEDPASHLSPQLKMPESLRPDQNYTVEVSEEAKKPMSYTLAVVDEGLLGLTRFQSPDPWDAFYAREALGVRTWDLYDQVMGAYTAEMQSVLTVGGGDMVNNPDNNQANRFKPVVKHYGPFYLEKGKKAKHELNISNYVGAVRVMLVAADEKGAYGHADKTVPVKKPLMVLSSLPRMLSPGENLSLPVNVFTTEDKIRSVNLNVEETSGLVQLTQNQQSLSFSKSGDQLATVNLQVGNQEGVARFKVVAKGGGETATEDIEIAIRNPNVVETRVANYTIEPGQNLDLSYTPFGSPGTREAVLEVSNLPPLNLGRRLADLLGYPYGCLEQTLSGGFPQLYVNKLLELNEDQKNQVPKNINATLERLKRFQLPNGGFGYWPGDGETNQWASSYAGHFLLEAKALGYSLPPGMLSKWKKYQKGAAKAWSPKISQYGYVSSHYLDLSQAYRLYTLALAGEADLGAMNQLREQNNLSKQARWRLAAAYAQAGKKQAANSLLAQQDTNIDPYRELAGSYGSDIRDRAMMLETLVLLEDTGKADDLVQRLSKELSAQRWMSTADISYSLLAIGKYVGDNKVSSTYSFTWQPTGANAIDGGGDRALTQLNLVDNGSNQAQNGILKNTSKQKLFVSTILRGQPLVSNATALAENLNIQVSYIDKNGQSLDPSRIKQGTDFTAKVTIKHPASLKYPYSELALSQIFPGGWEINNVRMDATQGEQNQLADYRDYRDDRVNTFFDLGEGKSTTFQVPLTAAYVGRYYLPPTSCEAMYDNSIFAQVPGQWVEVVN